MESNGLINSIFTVLSLAIRNPAISVPTHVLKELKNVLIPIKSGYFFSMMLTLKGQNPPPAVMK
jgi:hypothetical protein